VKLATACLAAALLLAGCTSPPSEDELQNVPPAAEAVEVVEPSLMSLPDPDREEFCSDPYIRAAVRLQGMGRPAATKALDDLARQERRMERRVVILCRMLFVKKPGASSADPCSGGPC
jgi:hypothetical protein